MELSYLNQNELDTTPFEASASFGDNWFVDAGITIYPGYDWEYTDSVKMASISGNGSTLTVIIKLINAANQTLSFTFTINSTDAEFSTYYADCNEANYGGTAFITIGKINNFSYVNAALNLAIQKQLVTNLGSVGIQKINIANQYQQQYTDSECSLNPVVTADNYKLEVTNLVGDIVLNAGKFINLSASTNDNSFSFSTVTNLTAGGNTDCAPIRVLPDGYSTDIEPGCGDLLYSINGVLANNTTNAFVVQGSRGIQTNQTDANTVEITVSPLVLFSALPSAPNC